MEIGGREIVFYIVVAFANIVEAITGFAGTMLAMPPAILLIGIREAKTVLNVVSIFVSAAITLKSRNAVNWKEVLKISALMLAGMAVGLYLFARLPVPALAKLYGLLILAVAAKGLLVKREVPLPPWALISILLAAGVHSGMPSKPLIYFAVVKGPSDWLKDRHSFF